jgi:hypothetical protein
MRRCRVGRGKAELLCSTRALPSLDVEDLIKQGKIAGGTRVVLGRTGIGVAVRKGAPKPDISTTDAFKLLDLFDRLGIASDIKSKLKSSASVSVEDAIATGRAGNHSKRSRRNTQGSRCRTRRVAPT